MRQVPRVVNIELNSPDINRVEQRAGKIVKEAVLVASNLAHVSWCSPQFKGSS